MQEASGFLVGKERSVCLTAGCWLCGSTAVLGARAAAAALGLGGTVGTGSPFAGAGLYCMLPALGRGLPSAARAVGFSVPTAGVTLLPWVAAGMPACAAC